MDPGAVAWAHSTVGADAVETWRERPWSEVGRASAGSAIWWLKISKAGTRYEGPLLRVLAQTGHRLIPDVIVHSEYPWFLIADAGPRLMDRRLSPTELIELWCRVLGEYADLQRSAPVDAVLAAEVPDFRPPRLPLWYEGLLDGHEWFSELVRSDLTQLERERAKRFLPRFERLAADLGDGPSVTVQHDDVHETNVLLGARPLGQPYLVGQLYLIDWGDAVVSHPFCSMGVTLDRLADQLAVPLNHPWIMRAADAYLEPWRADGWPRRQLLRQMQIARRVDHIIRAHAWIRGVGNLQGGQSIGLAESPPFWIRRLIAC